VIGGVDPALYYGFDEFDLEKILESPEIEIVEYLGLSTTSIGFILKKTR
jgi:hypothetical protein